MSERPPLRGEELANSASHVIGLALSLAASETLLLAAIPTHDIRQIVGVGVFAVTLVTLYGSSSIYHALAPGRAKHVCRLVDHVAIYLLIAGTFTPFALGVLRGPIGWTLLVTLWALAGAGLVLKLTAGFRYPRLSTAMYLGMGWLGVFAMEPLIERAGVHAAAWLVAGGLCYTFGVAFYIWERLRFGHLVWHLFVMAGSACHFLAVLWYSQPTG